ncbi:MAG: peptidogalycan biosysnthesis protein, partial [Pseudomonadota bacterium]
MDGDRMLAARTIAGMDEVDAEAWDAIANPPGAAYDPFVSHAFLQILEESGSARAEAGWRPMHLLLEDDAAPEGARLRAAAPMYLKGHSYGEYVFDHAWAHAFEAAGGRYYPKLQTCIPFTPAPGRRLLAADRAMITPLGAAAAQLAERAGVSSFHATFMTQAEWSALGEIGFLQRLDQQFHWENDGYATFDDFLAALASRKRKTLKK